jgi:hypothetical protein
MIFHAVKNGNAEGMIQWLREKALRKKAENNQLLLDR